jgi:uncharacterized protein (DUF2237 family)
MDMDDMLDMPEWWAGHYAALSDMVSRGFRDYPQPNGKCTGSQLEIVRLKLNLKGLEEDERWSLLRAAWVGAVAVQMLHK